MRNLFVSFLMLVATSVFADEYVMVGMGGVNASVRSSALGVSAASSAVAYSITGGHQFSEMLAVEAEYMNFGEVNFAGGSASGHAASASVVANAFLCQHCLQDNDWTIFGKAGIADTIFKLTPAAGYSLLVPASQNKIAPAWGLGIQVANNRRNMLFTRLAYNRYSAGDNSMSEKIYTVMISVGSTF